MSLSKSPPTMFSWFNLRKKRPEATASKPSNGKNILNTNIEETSTANVSTSVVQTNGFDVIDNTKVQASVPSVTSPRDFKTQYTNKGQTLAELVDPKLDKELETQMKKLIKAVLKLMDESLPPTAKLNVDVLEKSSKESTLAVGKELVDLIDKADSMYSEYKPKLDAFLKTLAASSSPVSNAVTPLSQGIECLENLVTDFADTHPVLKAVWSLITAGFKMVKNAAEVQEKFLEMVRQINDASQEMNSLKDSAFEGKAADIMKSGMDEYTQGSITLIETCLSYDEKNMVFRLVFAKSDVEGFGKAQTAFETAATAFQSKVNIATLVVVSDINEKVDVGLAINADINEKVDAMSAVLGQNNTMLTQFVKSKIVSEEDPLSFIGYPFNDSVALIQKLSMQSTEGTRKWLLDEIEEKFSSVEVYCLRGEAGVGKSVISGCLGKRLQDSTQLKAAFFCKSGDSNRNNLAALIQNVAHQLAQANPEFYNALVETHKVFYQQFKREPASVVELLDNYIVIPLSKWPENEPCFVILDALDELLSNSSLIKDIGTLLTKFSASKKVKLFVTTRTDKASMEQISPDRLTAIIRDFPHENEDNQHNLKDIELFAGKRLESTLGKKNFTDADIATLAKFFQEKSNGLFIWAAMALDKLSLTNTYKNIEWIASNSTQRMELLKIELQEIAKLGLYDFYTLAFERTYPPNEDKKICFACQGASLIEVDCHTSA
ncbi:hypothetical protein BCR33DRAFT_766937 [Rhizoclosmatium globosum]|uniref:Nephrocystin 3-like N-terminal domain-containing protein n=1 Tax=Rhizoclosmatium globosum TaxID=329046 RepID=A0A1Y2C816_9FUNG|nr:hypothetical protein BCR33DRAFT_766937 [Rhizoclosmatium globosum]|eukprot:ORY42455.1 hypothetical protein BCR33DRAFT_766937 [Rhizoclosmatium globosum]